MVWIEAPVTGENLRQQLLPRPTTTAPLVDSTRWSAASPQSSALAALRSVGLLDVLHEYDCGGLGRKPCRDGPCGASLRQAMRNPG